MTTFFAYSTLASTVIIPLILLGRGFGVESLFALFRWPRGRMLQVITVFVLALQPIAATTWLNWRARVLGEPTLLWAQLALLVWLWVRTLHLILSERDSSVPPESPSTDHPGNL